jgi:hypothetical protein
MRVVTISAWVILGVVLLVSPTESGQVVTQLNDKVPGQSRTQGGQGFSAEKQPVTAQAIGGAREPGHGQVPPASGKSPAKADPGLIF